MQQGQPSATALAVAAGLVRRFHCRETTDLVLPASASLAACGLEMAGPMWRWSGRVARMRPATVVDLIESLILPGITLHYVARKLAIMEAVREGIARGLNRVVILGGGLDGLGFTLAREGIDVVEIDHPATQVLKRAAVHSLGVPKGLRFVAADLSRESPLEWVGEGPCVLVAEGLLMYLRPERVMRLMSTLAVLELNSRVICTALCPDAGGSLQFTGGKRVSWWLRHIHEPFTWGATPEGFATILRANGLDVVQTLQHEELKQYVCSCSLKEAVLPRGEFVVVADVK